MSDAPPPVFPARDALSQLLALSKKATPGPWRVERGFLNLISIRAGFFEDRKKGDVATVFTTRHCSETDHRGRTTSWDEKKPRSEADAEFIVAAVNYVRSLEAVERTLTGQASTRDGASL